MERAARNFHTASDVRARNNEALRIARRNGHLEVAVPWNGLHATFALTASDACINDALQRIGCKLRLKSRPMNTTTITRRCMLAKTDTSKL